MAPSLQVDCKNCRTFAAAFLLQISLDWQLLQTLIDVYFSFDDLLHFFEINYFSSIRIVTTVMKLGRHIGRHIYLLASELSDGQFMECKALLLVLAV